KIHRAFPVVMAECADIPRSGRSDKSRWLATQGADDIRLEPALALVDRCRGRPGRGCGRAFLLGLHVDAAAAVEPVGAAHDRRGGDAIGSAVGRRLATLAAGDHARPSQIHGTGGIFRRAAGAAGKVVNLLASAFEALPKTLERFIDEPPERSERTAR